MTVKALSQAVFAPLLLREQNGSNNFPYVDSDSIRIIMMKTLGPKNHLTVNLNKIG